MFSYLDKLISSAFGAKKAAASKPPTIVTNEPVKQHYFTSMSEIAPDKSLPLATKVVHGESVPLEAIPFEATRSELIQHYVSLLKQGIKEERFSEVSPQDLISHYLFLKTLVAVEPDASHKELTKSLAEYLANKEPRLWEMAAEYTKESEYPIVRWLTHQQTNVNFILDFIRERSSEELTHNQKALMQQYKESPAFLFPNPVYMAWLNQSYEADSRLRPMYRERSSTHYYHANITDNLLMRTQKKQVNFAPQHYYQQGRGPVDSAFRFNINSSNLVRVQGRTLLFANNQNELIAVKVQKKGEAKSALTDEFQMADYLLKHQRRLNLQSQLPKPLGQYALKRADILAKCSKSPHYEQLKSLIGDATNLEVYVYKAPSSYFTYLHDAQQTWNQFSLAVKKNVHDLFMLLREGIVFPQLADIFHTHSDEEQRDDKGRYQALVQLLNTFQYELGRIDKWQKAVEYVNLRGSGLADLGDSVPISSLLTVSERTTRYYPELLSGAYHQTFFNKATGAAHSLFTNKRELFGNYLYLNTMAEYLLVTQLTLGSYAAKVTRTMDAQNKAAVWQQTAELMFYCCAEAVTLMTGMPQVRAFALLKQRANLENHYQQTQFWMTPDYAKLDDNARKFKQYELYPGESNYEVNDELVADIGLSLDGVNQDLGGYNQALPLKELEKLLYATVTLIEGTKQLDLQFFHQLDETERLISDAAGAEACYQAAVKLLDIARPGCHFQRRLALSYYDTIKLKYPTESPADLRFDAVAKHDAARKIVQFWKAHRNEVASSSAEAVSESEKSGPSVKK